jgi:hypothetical protein
MFIVPALTVAIIFVASGRADFVLASAIAFTAAAASAKVLTVAAAAVVVVVASIRMSRAVMELVHGGQPVPVSPLIVPPSPQFLLFFFKSACCVAAASREVFRLL